MTHCVHMKKTKVTDILDEGRKTFKEQFDYLCENYGRQFAIDYFSHQLNEDDNDQQQNQDNQQQQQGQPNQQQNQQGDQQQNEYVPTDKDLEEVKQGMISNFGKVKEIVSTFMKTYEGVVDEQMQGVITAIGEVDKTIGTLDLKVFTDLAKKKHEQDQQKSQTQQPQQQQTQQPNQNQQNQQNANQNQAQEDKVEPQQADQSKQTQQAVFDSLSDKECEAILEEYGLTYIFALNEDGSENIFQKFKQPLANAIAKIKSKFGNKPCKAITDIVKKAQAKGRTTLYCVLTAITLLSGSLSANAQLTPGFPDSLQQSMLTANVNMTKERGVTDKEEIGKISDRAAKEFVHLLDVLEDDNNNRYGASGVGCAEDEVTANRLAIEDVLSTLKQKYGEDAVQKYGLLFKTISTQSYTQRVVVGGNQTYKTYYTVIVVAYQAID